MENEKENKQSLDNEKAQPDSPLVVHKESDASYQPEPAGDGMTATHEESALDAPTIERHRYKKKKKSHKGAYSLLLLLVAAVAVCAALYFTGTFDFGLASKETTVQTTTKKSYTTQPVNRFEGIITVKGTYLFFEGTEVDGISGLIQEIKYLDEGTQFTVQDENADSNFLNYQVLKTLSDYGIKYKITHVVSSGLESKYETTAAPEKTTKKNKANKNQTSKAKD